MYHIDEHGLYKYRFAYLPIYKGIGVGDNKHSKTFNTIDECRDYLREYANYEIQSLQEKIEYLKKMPDLPIKD